MGILNKHGVKLVGDTLMVTYGSGYHSVLRTNEGTIEEHIEELLRNHFDSSDKVLLKVDLAVKTDEGDSSVCIEFTEKVWGMSFNPPIRKEDMAYVGLQGILNEMIEQRY